MKSFRDFYIWSYSLSRTWINKKIVDHENILEWFPDISENIFSILCVKQEQRILIIQYGVYF